MKNSIQCFCPQLLPWTDWVRFHESGCFLLNPNYSPAPFKFDTTLCHLCSDLRRLPIFADEQPTTGQADLERLILNHTPFVIRSKGAEKLLDTSRIQTLTLDQLNDFYVNHSKERDTCLFSSNLNVRDHLQYLDEVTATNQSTFAFWYGNRYKWESFQSDFEFPSGKIVVRSWEDTCERWYKCRTNFHPCWNSLENRGHYWQPTIIAVIHSKRLATEELSNWLINCFFVSDPSIAKHQTDGFCAIVGNQPLTNLSW